jgi:hypothetical protein
MSGHHQHQGAGSSSVLKHVTCSVSNLILSSSFDICSA